MRIVQPPGDAEMSLLLDLTNGRSINTDVLLFRDKFLPRVMGFLRKVVMTVVVVKNTDVGAGG